MSPCDPLGPRKSVDLMRTIVFFFSRRNLDYVYEHCNNCTSLETADIDEFIELDFKCSACPDAFYNFRHTMFYGYQYCHSYASDALEKMQPAKVPDEERPENPLADDCVTYSPSHESNSNKDGPAKGNPEGSTASEKDDSVQPAKVPGDHQNVTVMECELSSKAIQKIATEPSIDLADVNEVSKDDSQRCSLRCCPVVRNATGQRQPVPNRAARKS